MPGILALTLHQNKGSKLMIDDVLFKVWTLLASAWTSFLNWWLIPSVTSRIAWLGYLTKRDIKDEDGNLNSSPQTKIYHHTTLAIQSGDKTHHCATLGQGWEATLGSFLDSRGLSALSFSCCAIFSAFIDHDLWGLVSPAITQVNVLFLLVIHSTWQAFFI